MQPCVIHLFQILFKDTHTLRNGTQFVITGRRAKLARNVLRIMAASEEFDNYFINIAEKVANNIKAHESRNCFRKQIITNIFLNPTDFDEINYTLILMESPLLFLDRLNNVLLQLNQ